MREYSSVASILLLIVATATACSRPPTDRPVEVELVDLPAALILSDDRAIAYRAVGKAGSVVRNAELSTRPLLSRGVDPTAGFRIYEQVGEHYRSIAHRERGDSLVADLIAGRTYLVAEAFTGHLRASLNALCYFTVEEPRFRADIPRICTQILCPSEPFFAARLVETFGPLPGGMNPNLELGGWNPIPGDLCESCTRPRGGSDELPTLKLVCPSAPTPACDGQVLFNDDFDADTVGSAPLPSPAGSPPGDAVVVFGDVTIVGGSSQAARLSRGNVPPSLEGIVDTGATSDGSYCVKYKGQAGVDMREPVVTTFNASNGARAWQLIIDDDQAALTSGGVDFILLQDFTSPHNLRFDVDLDLQHFDMFVDGTSIVSNMPFLDTSFDVPVDLKFEMGQCILECFEADYTVDDVRVTKTD